MGAAAFTGHSGPMALAASDARRSKAMSEILFCPTGHHSAANVKFCYLCGRKMEPAKLCRDCGRRLHPVDKFCEECGKPTLEAEIDRGEAMLDASKEEFHDTHQ
jgi:hypothetical protein